MPDLTCTLDMRPKTGRLFERRGIVGALLIVPAFVVCALSHPSIKVGSWLDLTLNGAGWLTLMGAILLRLWAMLYVGGRKGTSLATAGPYAMCRHPLYVGSFLAS